MVEKIKISRTPHLQSLWYKTKVSEFCCLQLLITTILPHIKEFISKNRVYTFNYKIINCTITFLGSLRSSFVILQEKKRIVNSCLHLLHGHRCQHEMGQIRGSPINPPLKSYVFLYNTNLPQEGMQRHASSTLLHKTRSILEMYRIVFCTNLIKSYQPNNERFSP